MQYIAKSTRLASKLDGRGVEMTDAYDHGTTCRLRGAESLMFVIYQSINLSIPHLPNVMECTTLSQRHGPHK